MTRVRRELREAEAALRSGEPNMAAVVTRVGPPRLRARAPVAERFAALARAICYQQLAGRAAQVIHGRFTACFDGRPTADAVLATPPERLRACGLSGAKLASIRDLAARVEDGTLDLDSIGRYPDAEVIATLTEVRGIGEWTAQMFAIFELGRLDVWPTGDLGVRNGYRLVHGLAATPSPRELGPRGEPYRPYRSVAAWYCWRAVDTITP